MDSNYFYHILFYIIIILKGKCVLQAFLIKINKNWRFRSCIEKWWIVYDAAQNVIAALMYINIAYALMCWCVALELPIYFMVFLFLFWGVNSPKTISKIFVVNRVRILKLNSGSWNATHERNLCVYAMLNLCITHITSCNISNTVPYR